jgi:signal transduction histidine kinase
MNTAKILVVEDEKLVADDIRETLECLGYSVPTLAASGSDAISQVAKVQPDLVLMDIHLRGQIDGIEASKLIQKRFQIPIVYLTGNADSATLARVKDSQPFGFILKPFNEKKLAASIEIALVRHQVERSLNQTLANAEVSLNQQIPVETQYRSDYLLMIVHKLLNPVTLIKFAVDALQSHYQDFSLENQQKYLDLIQNATQDLNRLLDDVLTLERTHVERFECQSLFMDVVAVCEEMVESFQLSAGNLHRLIFSANQPSCWSYLDEKLVKHMLSNLLDNAIKYSPKGNKISLSLICTEERVCVTIQDWGIGIPKSALGSLFIPFQRASNVGKVQGAGLGLAITKQCVDLLDGTIAIDSELGCGSTFTVSFPRY